MYEKIRTAVEEEITHVRKQHGLDVSPEIGKVLYSFVTGFKNSGLEPKAMQDKFKEIMTGLELYLTFLAMTNVNLHELKESAYDFCRALEEKEKIGTLEIYLNGLKHRKPRAGQLPSAISEEWLNR